MLDRVARAWPRLLLVACVLGALAVGADYALRVAGLWSGGYSGDPGRVAHAAFRGAATLARAAVAIAAALAVVDQLCRGGPSLRWGWLGGPAALASAAVAIGSAWAKFLIVAGASFGDPDWPGEWGEGLHARPLSPPSWLQYQGVDAAGWLAAVAAIACGALFCAWVARAVVILARRRSARESK